MSEGQEDPETPFLRFPANLRRWTLKAIQRRLRLPMRRRKWERRNREATAPYRIASRQGRTPDGTGGGHVCILGDFTGRTGLSRAGLYELERLRAEHPDPEVHDLGPAIHRGEIIAAVDGPPVDRLYLLSAPDTYAFLLPVLPPDRVQVAWRTGLWVWEAPRLPPHWRFAQDLVDEIWTPSAFSAVAIRGAVGDIPVRVRPHPVRPPEHGTGEDAAAAMRARLGIGVDDFMGLAIMDVSICPARKNPWAHVAAWLGAFGDRQDRVLVMKVRVSKVTRVVLDELRTMIGAAGNVRLMEAELTDAEIAALQSAADVYLSLHRAEGYGLNIHECLALGTPVIATDWSANAEYGPAFPHYRGVPYHLVPCRDWTGHYADDDFSWAEADLDAAVRKLHALAGNHGSD